MRKDVADLADRDDIAGVGGRKIEDRVTWRRDGIVAAVARPEKARLRRSKKRPGDDTADIVGFQQFACDLADRIESLQPEFLFVRSNLEDTVGRSVADRFSRPDMPLPERGDDVGAGSVAVAEHAGQRSLFAKL